MSGLDSSGFEIIPNWLSQDTVSSLITAVRHSSIYRSRAGMRHALEIDAVRSLACDSKLLHLASDAVGNRAIPFRATLFDKSPKSNWLVVWHQDTALPLRKKRDVPGWGPWSIKEKVICAHAPASALEQIVAIRVHLDDSAADNGPLRVLPGTHRLGVLSDEAIHDLAQHTPAVECHVGSGGLLLMRPLLVHASSKATSTTSRRVLHIEYSVTDCFGDGIGLYIR